MLSRRAALASLGVGAGLAALWHRRSTSPSTALRPGHSLFCPLLSRRWETADTLRLTFALPSASHVLGLPVPGHLVAIDPAMVYRPYTPITIDSLASGHFELLVRHYPRGELSSRLARLAPGDAAHFRGPVAARYEYERGRARQLGLVAAGTGIAPMWQLIQAVTSDPDDHTTITLLYASRTADGILLKAELDAAVQQFPEQLSVVHVVSDGASSAPASSPCPTRIDAALLQRHMPPPEADGTTVLVCGPEGFVRSLCGPAARDGGENRRANVASAELGGMLKELGYSDNQVCWL
ncbi:hypothetical protein AB1Y20_010998 [Prymnesium parvum]|uniref:NADH-cytochrome b5 reductase n=1 Tax=Prymnesium parvum TaxID=97485 RepID=A0AB34IKK4_PRYPA